MKIIYQTAAGELYVMNPTGVLSDFETARKDVPAGQPFLILPDDQVPPDWEFMEAWEVDFSNPDGYGIGPEAWFLENPQEETPQEII